MPKKKKNVVIKKVFKSVVDNSKHYLIIKIFNNRAVECTWYDGNFGKTFVGKSICNVKEGDIFNLSDGIDFAYKRAIHKRNKFYNKAFQIVSHNYTSQQFIPISRFAEKINKLI
jgi:hypothetical protein